MADNDRRTKGVAMYREVLHPDQSPDSKPAVGIRELTLDHLFANVWSRGQLALQERRLVTIALLAVQGHDRQLKAHIRGALRAGVPEETLSELMIHVAHYGGWAAGTSGHDAIQTVKKEEVSWKDKTSATP